MPDKRRLILPLMRTHRINHRARSSAHHVDGNQRKNIRLSLASVPIAAPPSVHRDCPPAQCRAALIPQTAASRRLSAFGSRCNSRQARWPTLPRGSYKAQGSTRDRCDRHPLRKSDVAKSVVAVPCGVYWLWRHGEWIATIPDDLVKRCNGAARVLVSASALAKHLSWSGRMLISWSIRA